MVTSESLPFSIYLLPSLVMYKSISSFSYLVFNSSSLPSFTSIFNSLAIFFSSSLSSYAKPILLYSSISLFACTSNKADIPNTIKGTNIGITSIIDNDFLSLNISLSSFFRIFHKLFFIRTTSNHCKKRIS